MDISRIIEDSQKYDFVDYPRLDKTTLVVGTIDKYETLSSFI